MKSFDQVSTSQNRCKVLIFLEVSCTLLKICLPFDQATPLVHFPKALKRPRNTAGPASLYYIIFIFIIIDGCHYVWQKAQTAILHYIVHYYYYFTIIISATCHAGK